MCSDAGARTCTSTVDPLHKGHARTMKIVLYREVKLCTKVLALQVSFIERCPLFRGFIMHESISIGSKQVSFIERCPLLRVSFIRGSTVLYSYTGCVSIHSVGIVASPKWREGEKIILV